MLSCPGEVDSLAVYGPIRPHCLEDVAMRKSSSEEDSLPEYSSSESEELDSDVVDSMPVAESEV